MKLLKRWALIILVGYFPIMVLNGNDRNIAEPVHSISKIKDIVIYEDPIFYSTFPSVIRRPSGEYIVAFRRAPDRQIFGERGTSHVDPKSYLVRVGSSDGETWSEEPQLIYAHPFGRSQNPCLLQLSEGTLICTSYGWAFVREEGTCCLLFQQAEWNKACCRYYP